MDQRGEITVRVEETKRKRRRSSRVRGSTLEEAEQGEEEEEEDDRDERQVLVQETTVEEVALPLSPLPFYTQTDKLKERDYIAFFFNDNNNRKGEIL